MRLHGSVSSDQIGRSLLHLHESSSTHDQKAAHLTMAGRRVLLVRLSDVLRGFQDAVIFSHTEIFSISSSVSWSSVRSYSFVVRGLSCAAIFWAVSRVPLFSR